MLAAALAAGNALNMGTSHTGALGFSLGTLQKLSNLKVGGAGHQPLMSELMSPQCTLLLTQRIGFDVQCR